MRKITTAIIALVVLLGAFSATAFAASAATGDGSLLDLARPVFDAVMGGQYLFAAVLGLVLAVAAVKRYVAPRWAPLQTEAGMASMVLVAAFAGALATGGADALSVAAAWAALKLAMIAAGGWKLVKMLVVDPILRPLAARSPSWMQPMWMVIFWAFDKPAVVVQAEAAGDAAVETKPADGTSGIVGFGREIK